MRADELFALADARSIDLKAVAGNASNTHGLAAKRIMNRLERKLARGRPLTETVEGNQTRVMRAAAWSHAELAMALAGGLERMPQLAGFYSLLRDDKPFSELLRNLMLLALRIATDEDWPMRIAPEEDPFAYIPRICGLVLDADRHAFYFGKAPNLYPAYMRVTDDVWRKRLERRYAELKIRYDSWVDEAVDHVDQRLRRLA